MPVIYEGQEQLEIFRTTGIIFVQLTKLRFAKDAANLVIAKIVSRNGKNEIGVQLRVIRNEAVFQRLIIRFSNHTVSAQHSKVLIKPVVVCADHAAFDGAHMVGVIEREV